MICMRYWPAILFSLIFIQSSYSQNSQPSFKHYTTTDGLSNNWVRCIYMDDIGYMWFGTADGLNKFDGHSFKIYHIKTHNGRNIGNINISGILRKSAFELWVCTDLGVYVYNYLDDQLHPFPLLKSRTTLCLIKDHKGIFWFGTSSGLCRYDSDSNVMTTYKHDSENPASLSNSYVNIVFEDSEHNLWIGTKGGLNLYSSSGNSFIHLSPKNISISRSTNDLLSIVEDHNKRLWVGYAQDGLFVLNIKAVQTPDFKKVMEGKVIKLMVDSENSLWIGRGSGEGLDKLNLDHFSNTGIPRFQHLRSVQDDFRSLSDNSIYCLYEDRYKDIWLGTFGNGFNYYSPRAKKFNVVNENSHSKIRLQNNLVNAFGDDDTHLYVGTEAGLDVFDKKKGVTRHFTNDPENSTSLSANPVYALCKDHEGKIWVGTWGGGLNLYMPETGTFKRYMPGDKEGSISSGNVFAVFEDNRNNLWVGTIGGGLNRFEQKTGKFRYYKNDPENPSSIYGDMVDYIYQTTSGNLYVSAYNSLDLYDYEKDNFIHYLHDPGDSSRNFGNILSLFEDSRHNLWIATNAGLELFDEKKKIFRTVDLDLPDQTIQGILEDDHGNLWISTNKGISKFIHGIELPVKPKVFNYTPDDGLSANEFKKRAAFRSREGYMYFGSSDGFTSFYPDSIVINRIPPRVIISGFSLLKPLTASDGKYGNLAKSINNVETLDLPYHNADFVISFAALNYLNSKNNHFKYRLEGYDPQWIDADYTQSAKYTNLNPGEYEFKVIASNNDGVWCDAPKTLKIIVHPPWWKTIFFKILAVLLFVMSMALSYQLLFRRLEHQKRDLEKKVHERTRSLSEANHLLEQKQEEITAQFEELSKYKNHLESLVEERTSALKDAKEKAEESDRLKTAFLQNLSHEIRTPLNAIMGFSGLLESNFNNKEALVNFAGIIEQSGHDLMSLIEEIIDISKIETGMLRLVNESCLLDELIFEIETYARDFQKRLHKEHIKFISKNDLAGHEVVLDRGKLKQIILNLVGNAFKFTESGIIEFGCCRDGTHMLKFYVSDTGIGIPEDKYGIIFERFRQIDEMQFREGAGLGLSISKGLVQLLGGQIWLASKVKEGTTFYFTIPYIEETANHQTDIF
jgi:signal transduction histidine kinase/ligand-binding sensor domain-containing protein